MRIVLLLFFTIFISTTAMSGNFTSGRDIPIVYLTKSQLFQFDSVGSIFCYDLESDKYRQLGTATLVKLDTSGDVVLTNEHVLDVEKNLVWCKFGRMGNTHDEFYVQNISKRRIFGGYSSTGRNSDDWAVAKLEGHYYSELLNRTPVIYGLSTHLPKNEKTLVSLIGFELVTESLGMVPHCHAYPQLSNDRRKGDSGLILHDCSTMGGWSGGPVFVWKNNQYEIVAIHSGWSASYGGGDEHPPSDPFDPRRYANYAVIISQKILNAINSL